MNNRIPLTFILLLLVQGGALAGTIDTFQNGGKEATADLYTPLFSATQSLVVPADCIVLNATMRASAMPSTGTNPCFPSGVSVMLDKTTLWTFNGTGYGSFGRQQQFSDGGANRSFLFGSGGGSYLMGTRLPKNATVINATLEVRCTAPVKPNELVRLDGFARNDKMGCSVAAGGDINGDGYDDAVIGSYCNTSAGPYTGTVYVLLGGPALDNVPDVVLSGRPGEMFGCSVSGAGDVNGDSFEDIVVGASRNNTSGVDSGKAYLFFGGKTVNSTPDIVFKDSTTWDEFGISVAGAGDVNGDGFDDVLIGAPGNRTGGSSAGMAFIYLGGTSMDSKPDIFLRGLVSYGDFGTAVAGAGDVNGDGFNDVIVGGPHEDESGNDLGKARLFYGGNPMNNVSDLNLTGCLTACHFGCAVSGAGDVNCDGYDDLIVGEVGNASGRARLYFGGPGLDSVPELNLTGSAVGDSFGCSVSNTHDVNGDGFDDIVVGAYANDQVAQNAGRAYMFFGGKGMDAVPDVVINGWGTNDNLGLSVSGAGDLNGDSRAEFIIGAENNDSAGFDAGRACIYSAPAVVTDPSIAVGSATIWRRPNGFNGTETVADFSDALNQYLSANPPSLIDTSGNELIDVPLKFAATSNGTVVVGKLDLVYQYNVTVRDFSIALNSYVRSHQAQKDPQGNIAVPLTVRSLTAGMVRLLDIHITTDEPPRLIGEMPDLGLDEDTINTSLMYLPDHFRDDLDQVGVLKFELASLTNSNRVKVWISERLYLCADAKTGGANDNWTGTVQGKFSATDSRGQRTEVPLTIIIRSVNDPPLITSDPIIAAVTGEPYTYQLWAVDGDRDRLAYGLALKSDGMTIDSTAGTIRWTPARRGAYDVSVAVDDGQARSFQNFTIAVPNRLPDIKSLPPALAFTGQPYVFKVDVSDIDGDPLEFALESGLEGMSIDPVTGLLEWVPALPGTYNFQVAISDGFGASYLNFTLLVMHGNLPPQFSSDPPLNATVGKEYSYDPFATDEEGDPISFSMSTNATGLRFNPKNGGLRWVPTASEKGRHPVTIRATDGKCDPSEQSFTITVEDPPFQARLRCAITAPAEGTIVQHHMRISGIAEKERHNITRVEVRIDDGEWRRAQGTSQWELELDTTGLSNGPHTIYARADDGSSYSELSVVEITVDNPAPRTAGPGWLLLPTVAVLAAALAAALFFFWKKRRK